jgi:hypothetical protein
MSNSEILLLTETESINLPTYTFSQQTSLMGSYDMYLTSFDMNSLFPTWGTYYGGAIVEDASDIKLINSNEVVVCGSSNSSDYPVSTGAYQTSLNNSTDGVITKINITKTVSTIIEENFLDPIIEIYPNPFNDYLYIKSKNSFLIEIKTLLGETIYRRTNDDYISTKDLSPGVYIVTANSKSYRFIKQ